MSVALVTGSSGLVGSESVKHLHEKGFEVVGIDNDLRSYFFGKAASTAWNTRKLQELPRFHHLPLDIRDAAGVETLFSKYGKNISTVVHTAAQPSHDWAAREPMTDFSVNAVGTLVLLEAFRKHCPDASFVFTSTNKVYGDTPNRLPLVEQETRWELAPEHPYHDRGIDESMSVDDSKHSLFGVSKLAADIMTQEYGRYFGLKTAVFRGGCLTGPAHSGAELHGFLSYLVQCAVTGKPYTVFGYKGKQVRDNIHSHDLVSAFWCFIQKPRSAVVYNIGGSRHSNCSILEAVRMTQELTGKEMSFSVGDQARSGDHIWWISDVNRFRRDYPDWNYQYNIRDILSEIVEETKRRSGGNT